MGHGNRRGMPRLCHKDRVLRAQEILEMRSKAAPWRRALLGVRQLAMGSLEEPSSPLTKCSVWRSEKARRLVWFKFLSSRYISEKGLTMFAFEGSSQRVESFKPHVWFQTSSAMGRLNIFTFH